ncbi:MAG: cysteine desulfurase sulfur acceptor subunit CsdE [Candidatus Malihini olakiniferum]
MRECTTHPFGSTITVETLQHTFDACRSWEERYRQLILLAKQLPALPEALKNENIALSGCANRVWLGCEKQQDGRLHFYGDSDGRIVRGFLAVLLTGIEGKQSADFIGQDLFVLFDKLGLRAQLNASRARGLSALAQRIQTIEAQAIKNIPP